MTLIVATRLPGGGTWMAGDRIAGGFDYKLLSHPKVFKLDAGGTPFALGFAGSPRVAQVVTAVEPPPWEPSERSLHWWLTEFCDRIRDRAECQGVLVHAGGGSSAELAGNSGMLLAIAGHVILIDCYLAWSEPDRGWQANGGAFETFSGAYEVLREMHDPIEAARRAWPVVERHHHIGPIADEIHLP